MQTKVEGIITKKTPVKEKDLICHLLLRSGKRISVYFYGGRGGGKKSKSSILEVGFMISVELSQGKTKSTDLYSAKEWNLVWGHEKIRDSFQKFGSACLFLEVIEKVATSVDLNDDLVVTDQTEQGLFNVLSNALYELDREINETRQFIHLGMFFGKLFWRLGVYPDLRKCCHCEQSLSDEVTLVSSAGGFSCGSCQEGQLVGGEVREFLGSVVSTKYRDIGTLPLISREGVKLLVEYFCYQFQFSQSDFLSLSFSL